MAGDGALHGVAQELSRVSLAARQGRSIPLDAAALAAVVDGEVARLVAGRREAILQSLSKRMSP